MASVSRLVSKDCSLDRNQPGFEVSSQFGRWRQIIHIKYLAKWRKYHYFESHCIPSVVNALSHFAAVVLGPSDAVDFVQQHLKDFSGFDVSEIANLGYGVFLDASKDYFEAWQLFVSCGDVIMTLKTTCRAVITDVESGASFPLKRRDLMLDYILTLMGREESDGYPGSNLELLHTQSVALSVSDWFFDRMGVSAIDCPYPCDNTCHNLVFNLEMRNLKHIM
ncbi:hypothetical protein Syun_009323 [Stephania yunnanensis]|uniref:Pectin acetylesterase n=1 Tax=Stephania yunnanensis TaxID=152371 RepID=A0AAP0PQJ3_9MAGN